MYFLTVGPETPVAAAMPLTDSPLLALLLISSTLSTPIISFPDLLMSKSDRIDNCRSKAAVGAGLTISENFRLPEWKAAFTIFVNQTLPNTREVAEGLARDGVCGQQDVPTAYRYLVLNKNGYVLMTDLEGTRLEGAAEMARAALAADPGTVEIEGGGSGLTYAAFPLKGGGACALVSEYLPQWVSRDLAGLLPNPQNLMLVGAAAGSALALVARRASRVISRKMAPLAEAAGRVGAGELDFAVGSTNVREVNDVLAAMDAMRASLAESLEARWAAERGQREQVASLAHDLKTPLTVLRANADFVAEELEDEKDADLAAAARDIAGSAERLDGYVRLLIEASRGSGEAERAPCGRPSSASRSSPRPPRSPGREA